MSDHNESKNCPWCGKPLESGSLRNRGRLYFLPDGESPPLWGFRSHLEKKRAVVLGQYFYGAEPVAAPRTFACRDCRKLIVEFTDDDTPD